MVTRSQITCNCSTKLPNDTVCKAHKIKILKNVFKGLKTRKLVATKICSQSDCTNKGVLGGKCYRHSNKWGCKNPGCTKLRQTGGFCKAHGGKHKNSKCKREGCTKFSQGGGFCYKHGGGYRCKLRNCGHSAHSSSCKVCNKHIVNTPTLEIINNI